MWRSKFRVLHGDHTFWFIFLARWGFTDSVDLIAQSGFLPLGTFPHVFDSTFYLNVEQCGVNWKS